MPSQGPDSVASSFLGGVRLKPQSCEAAPQMDTLQHKVMLDKGQGVAALGGFHDSKQMHLGRFVSFP